MEGRNDWLGDREAANQRVHALHHLLRSLVGESHGQDGLGHDAPIFDEICDAVGDDPGFAAARARQDEHRPARGFDGFALLRVELIEKGQVWNGSGAH